MSTEVLLFSLRVISGLSLLGFAIVLFYLVWRSFRSEGEQLAARQSLGVFSRDDTNREWVSSEW